MVWLLWVQAGAAAADTIIFCAKLPELKQLLVVELGVLLVHVSIQVEFDPRLHQTRVRLPQPIGCLLIVALLKDV